MRIALVVIVFVLGMSWWVIDPLARPNSGEVSSETLKLVIDSGDLAAVRDQIKRGADVNGRSDGTTPLVRATICGKPDMVLALLELGADVNHTTVSGHTALSMALTMERDDIVRLLLRAGADPSLRSELGINAFDVAKIRGNDEMTSVLEDALREAPADAESHASVDLR